MKCKTKSGKIIQKNLYRQNKKIKGELLKDRSQSMVTHHYYPITPVRLYLENHFSAANNALTAVKNMEPLSLKNVFPLSGESKKVYSNSDLSIEVGELQQATASDVEAAVQTSLNFYVLGSLTHCLMQQGPI